MFFKDQDLHPKNRFCFGSVCVCVCVVKTDSALGLCVCCVCVMKTVKIFKTMESRKWGWHTRGPPCSRLAHRRS